MELTVMLAAILAINVTVFLGGCLLAGYRTWGPAARATRRRRKAEGGVPH